MFDCFMDRSEELDIGQYETRQTPGGVHVADRRNFLRKSATCIVGGAAFVAGIDNAQADPPGTRVAVRPDSSRSSPDRVEPVELTDEMPPISKLPPDEREAERKRRQKIWFNECKRSKLSWAKTLDPADKEVRMSYMGELNAYQELYPKRYPSDLGHSNWTKDWKRVPGSTKDYIIYQYAIEGSQGDIIKQTPWYVVTRSQVWGDKSGTKNPNGHMISFETDDLNEALSIADTLYNESVEHFNKKADEVAVVR